MADNVSLSLDDIIKKQRKQKQIKVKGVKGFRTRPGKVAGNFQGRVSRNFSFKNGRGNGNGSRQTVSSRRGSNRYFTTRVALNKLPARGGGRGKQQFNRINNRVNINGRGSRKPLYQQRSKQEYTVEYPSYQRPGPSRQQPQFIPGRNQKGRRTWTQNITHQNFVSPARNANKQRKFKLAKKRVQKARELLIASRIAQNIRSQGQSGRQRLMPRGTGRIAVGRFGLVTTQKANLGQYRSTIQQKIVRAQMARQGVSNSPMFRGQGQLRQENFAVSFSQAMRPSYSGRGSRNSRGSGLRSLFDDRPTQVRSDSWPQDYALRSPGPGSGSRGGRRRRYESPREEDAWDIPMRTVQNNSRRSINEVEINRGQRNSDTRVAGTLDPKIQSHISFIQEQGRRVRGEHKHEQHPTPTVSVSYSSMTLSDRFKGFMH